MLSVKNLSIAFSINEEYVKVTDGVSFNINRGETLGIVGESGCGKSVTVQSLMGLLPKNSAQVKADEVLFNGKNLLKINESEWCKIRGNEISMIFQNPMTCLNPLMKCGKQITEVITKHQNKSRQEAKNRAIELLDLMGIMEPKKHFDYFPHQLSGGMRQRVMIAIALACEPKILIADEPTTSLDVTIQAQILKLIRELQEKMDMALILITHDLGVVEDMVDNLIVMYAGQIVEKGNTEDVLKKSLHPYTRGLIRSIPKLNQIQKRLSSIEGTVPIPTQFPTGCRFYQRCDVREDSCKTLGYELFENRKNRSSSCQFWQKEETKAV